MTLYIANLVLIGEADHLEDFTDTMYKALDGDAEAQKIVRIAEPHVIAVSVEAERDALRERAEHWESEYKRLYDSVRWDRVRPE